VHFDNGRTMEPSGVIRPQQNLLPQHVQATVDTLPHLQEIMEDESGAALGVPVDEYVGSVAGVESGLTAITSNSHDALVWLSESRGMLLDVLTEIYAKQTKKTNAKHTEYLETCSVLLSDVIETLKKDKTIPAGLFEAMLHAVSLCNTKTTNRLHKEVPFDLNALTQVLAATERAQAHVSRIHVGAVWKSHAEIAHDSVRMARELIDRLEKPKRGEKETLKLRLALELNHAAARIEIVVRELKALLDRERQHLGDGLDGDDDERVPLYFRKAFLILDGAAKQALNGEEVRPSELRACLSYIENMLRNWAQEPSVQVCAWVRSPRPQVIARLVATETPTEPEPEVKTPEQILEEAFALAAKNKTKARAEAMTHFYDYVTSVESISVDTATSILNAFRPGLNYGVTKKECATTTYLPMMLEREIKATTAYLPMMLERELKALDTQFTQWTNADEHRADAKKKLEEKYETGDYRTPEWRSFEREIIPVLFAKLESITADQNVQLWARATKIFDESHDKNRPSEVFEQDFRAMVQAVLTEKTKASA
jgi:hypothetical protein